MLGWEMPLEALADVPALPALTRFERDALDYTDLGMSPRPHPIRHERPQPDRRGVLRIADLDNVADGRIVRVAGWVISAQRPPTAHGVGFVVLEDETGRLPVAMAPTLAADLRGILRDAHYLIAVGRFERVRWYRSLWAFELMGVQGLTADAAARVGQEHRASWTVLLALAASAWPHQLARCSAVGERCTQLWVVATYFRPTPDLPGRDPSSKRPRGAWSLTR